MKAREYKYPNVVSFFLILSPLIYNIINNIIIRISPNISIAANVDASAAAALAGLTTENNMYFFGIICASFMVLFGNRNKYLYPTGITIALLTTASTFFNLMFRSIAANSALQTILCLLQIIASIIMFISIVLALHKDKKAEKIATIASVCYMILVVIMAIGRSGLPIPGLNGVSIINSILSFIKMLMYINIPIAVHILVGHALATGQIKDGNLTLENK